jgi:DNA polymerase-1
MSNRVMIVDALNMFIRAYIVNPSVSTNGNPIGAVVGFLGMLKKQINEVKPSQVVICWDGKGGSNRRREVVKEYKEGRKPIKKNYEVDGMTEQSEKDNKIWQQQTLMEIINHLPFIQLIVDNVEADDIIAYVAKSPLYKNYQKVIVSSDKDFIQLLDEKTILFRPIQDKIHNVKNVVEEYNIHPTNFAIARAIAGDPSDNLDGVAGAGLKTIAKRLDFLSQSKEHSLQEVFDFCENYEGKIKFYQEVANSRTLVETNYKLMKLVPPMISPLGTAKILYSLENFVFELNATKLKTIAIENGFASFDWSDLLTQSRSIIYSNKKE